MILAVKGYLYDERGKNVGSFTSALDMSFRQSAEGGLIQRAALTEYDFHTKSDFNRRRLVELILEATE